jgi:hypothetical protein
MLKSPRHGQRPATEQNQNHRFPRMDNSLEQFLLPSGKPQVGTRRGFPAHPRIFPESQNHQIRFLRTLDRSRDSGVRPVKNANALESGNMLFPQRLRQSCGQ